MYTRFFLSSAVDRGRTLYRVNRTVAKMSSVYCGDQAVSRNTDTVSQGNLSAGDTVPHYCKLTCAKGGCVKQGRYHKKFIHSSPYVGQKHFNEGLLFVDSGSIGTNKQFATSISRWVVCELC